MTVSITQEHNEARLAGTLAFLDTGSSPARLRIYGGARPAAPAAPEAGDLLAEIALAKPAGVIAAGVLTLAPAGTVMVLATGEASWARLLTGDDVVALDMDCSEVGGGGDVTLDSVTLYAGGQASLVAAVLG